MQTSVPVQSLPSGDVYRCDVQQPFLCGGRRVPEQPTIRTVRVQDAILHVERRASSREPLQPLERRLDIVGMHQVEQRLRQKLGLRMAERFFESRVDVQKVRIDVGDAQHCRRKQEKPPLVNVLNEWLSCRFVQLLT